MEGVDVMEMKEVGFVPLGESNTNSDCDRVKKKRNRKKNTRKCVEESSIKAEAGEYESKAESCMKEGNLLSHGGSEKKETFGSVPPGESNINSDCDKVKKKRRRKKYPRKCVEESSIKAEAGEYESKAESCMKKGNLLSDGGSEKNETFGSVPPGESNINSDCDKVKKKRKRKYTRKCVEESSIKSEAGEYESKAESCMKEDNLLSDGGSEKNETFGSVPSGESNINSDCDKVKKKRRRKNTRKCVEESSIKAEAGEYESKAESCMKEGNLLSDGGSEKKETFEKKHTASGDTDCDKVKKKSTERCVEESSIKAEAGEYESKEESCMKEVSPLSDGGSEKNGTFETKHTASVDAEDERADTIVREDNGEKILDSSNGKTDQKIMKRKKRLLKEAAKAKMRGICYLSRVPPHMDPLKLRQILSQYGEIQRIYLVPEDAANQVQRKRAGGFRGQFFSEGWVEFTDKRVAKKLANMLNGEPIGGKKRSSFYYDLWNIKYLSKFKWDNLTEETAYKHAIREQKMALEISAAKRERDFYLSKVDKSRALNSIEERLKKKQKLLGDSEMNSELADSQKLPKLIRNFPQTQPLADSAVQNKQRLSKNTLAGVFGSS